MKLRNKKTGEIGFGYTGLNGEVKVCSEYDEIHTCLGQYSSLFELDREWEDYEEPKEYWFIDYDSGIIAFNRTKDTATDRMMREIGNYFETKEEAEKAVEKLKAWKRLKEAGFRTYDICQSPTGMVIHFDVDWKIRGVGDDLDLLFGGEE